MDNNIKQNIYLVYEKNKKFMTLMQSNKTNSEFLILMKQRTNLQNSSETPMCATLILQILPICRMKVKKAKIMLLPTT